MAGDRSSAPPVPHRRADAAHDPHDAGLPARRGRLLRRAHDRRRLGDPADDGGCDHPRADAARHGDRQRRGARRTDVRHGPRPSIGRRSSCVPSCSPTTCWSTSPTARFVAMTWCSTVAIPVGSTVGTRTACRSPGDRTSAASDPVSAAAAEATAAPKRRSHRSRRRCRSRSSSPACDHRSPSRSRSKASEPHQHAQRATDHAWRCRSRGRSSSPNQSASRHHRRRWRHNRCRSHRWSPARLPPSVKSTPTPPPPVPAKTEVDAASIADEVAEAIKRAFAGLGG